MKKILFLLLCTVSIYGQTSTGQEQEFDYGIKNNSLQTITTPTYIGTFGTDGTQGKIPSAYIAKTAAVQDSLNKKLNLPTGFLQGLQLSINADPTKFNIAAGYYVVTDFTNLTQPVVKIINYAGATGLTPAYLATANSTYVALDINGAVVSSASPFTDAQRRTLAIVGNVVHSNNTTINVTNEIKAPIVAVGNQLHDFMKAIGFLNESGNVYSANGSNLQINKSVGDIFGMGINASDYLSPHKLTIPSQTALTFAYRFQNGTQLADTQNINPNIYDVGGTSTATPSNKWTIQRINLFQSGLSRIQPGQTVYNSFNDAVVALPTQPFVTEQNIADNAVFRCYLIVQQGTTNLASAVAGGSAQFVPVDKFGNIIGNGSVALTYSNIIAALGFTPANDADVVKLTGNQTKTGTLTFDNATNISAIRVDNTGGGIASFLVNSSNGGGSYILNQSTGHANVAINSSTGVANVLNSETASTGDLVNYQKNKVVTASVDQNGVHHLPNNVLWTNSNVASTTDFVNKSNYIPISFRSKSIYWFGDSYTEGSMASPVSNRFTSLVSKALGATEINFGVGGSTIEKRTPIDYMGASNMIDRMNDIPTKTTSMAMLVFSYGINDMGQTSPEYNVANFKTDYQTVLSNALGKGWLPSQILIIPPFYIGSTGYATYAVITGNAAPDTARHLSFIQACKELASSNGIMYFDIYDDQSKNDTTLLQTDGLHPTNAGYAYIASDILHFLGAEQIGLTVDSSYSSGSGFLAKNIGGVISNSKLYETSTGVGVNNISPSTDFDVAGNTKSTTIENRYSIDISSTDLNSLVRGGNFTGTNLTNAPDSGAWYINSTQNSTPTQWRKQTATAYGLSNSYPGGTIFERVYVAASATWTSWKEVVFSDSPALTGTPTAPTAAPGTNTTQIATTAFVQENARPYKVYTALLSQSGTSAPTATVLENTLGGTVVWTRSGIGSYQATLTGSVYTSSKTVVFATIGLNKNLVINGARVSDSVVSIMAGTGDLDSTNMSIEIRVYN